MRILGKGIIVVATSLLPGLPAIAQHPVEVSLEPSRTFTSEPFSRVRGVQELPDGRVLVADQDEKALYRIDFLSQERITLGRQGGGPGEYESPVGLHPFL